MSKPFLVELNHGGRVGFHGSVEDLLDMPDDQGYGVGARIVGYLDGSAYTEQVQKTDDDGKPVEKDGKPVMVAQALPQPRDVKKQRDEEAAAQAAREAAEQAAAAKAAAADGKTKAKES